MLVYLLPALLVLGGCCTANGDQSSDLRAAFPQLDDGSLARLATLLEQKGHLDRPQPPVAARNMTMILRECTPLKPR